MCGEEISQDLCCLIFGIMVALFSGVGIYTVNFILNKKDSSSSKIDEVKKKLRTAQSNSKQKDGMLEEDPQRQQIRASASPFSLVQLHPKSTSKASVSDNWKLPRSKEVEVTLDIAKSKSNDNNLDVQMGIVVDPESQEPLNIQVDGIIDKEMNQADISGNAKSKAGESVKIEGQLGNKTKKTMAMDLDTKKGSTDKMVLRSKRN